MRLGILVGTEYSLVERSAKKLKAVLTAHLQKVYKREGDYPYLEMSDPIMRMIELDSSSPLDFENAHVMNL